MNWDAISFDWNQVRAFLATAEHGSLSAAARALRLTQPTVGRQVTALEEDLGVVLFERSGRAVTLTQTGMDLVDHVRIMAEAATQISLTASGRAQAVEGLVRITASDVMCAVHLPGVLRTLSEIAPLVEIELIADNQIRDLLHREADIAIRHSRPTEPDLIAKLVRTEEAHFYASTDYLARRGRPEDPSDLSAHEFIGMTDNARLIAYLADFGIALTLKQFRYGSPNGVAAWEMARAGLGIAIMSEPVGTLAQDMERLSLTPSPITFPIWLVTHREIITSRRIRVVYDHLAGSLATAQKAQ